MAKQKSKKMPVKSHAGAKKAARNREIPAEQGKNDVGYKNPPKEHRFKPGQSGNPEGPPVHRTNLWVWFCKYMTLTDAELEQLARDKLTQAQQTALTLVQNAKNGKGSGSQRLALAVFDREEGRAVEHLHLTTENELTEDECDEIRELMLGNHTDQ
jgi:hypothetical protein